MFPIDNSTASTTLPVKKPVGIPGYFTAGTIGGVAATIVEADWLNIVQNEIVAVLTAAAITPDKTNDAQLIAAILQLIADNTRRRLSGPLDLYVAATGSDTNNGLTPTTPYATMQVVGAPGAGILFVGDTVSPTSVVINALHASAVWADYGANITVQGMHFQASDDGLDFVTQGNGIISNNSAVVSIANVDFGTCSQSQMVAFSGIISSRGSPYSASSNAKFHARASGPGQILVNSSHLTLTNTPTFSVGFVDCDQGGLAHMETMTFTGTAHGPHFNVVTNGVLNLAGANGNTYLPGDVTGVQATGGQIS
jgi:hypothetical protein